MKKETILVVVVALVVGLLAGIIVTSGSKPSVQAPAVGNVPSAPVVNQQQVTILEGIVRNDPKNREAWVQLGNLYFDGNEPVKSVEAYSKALEIKGDDPNILTDQGVMFRKLGWFDKAIENFSKAQEIAPGHKQSLFNMGIVYRYDLQDFGKATETWQKYLDRFPADPASQQVKLELDFLKNHPATPQ